MKIFVEFWVMDMIFQKFCPECSKILSELVTFGRGMTFFIVRTTVYTTKIKDEACTVRPPDLHQSSKQRGAHT